MPAVHCMYQKEMLTFPSETANHTSEVIATERQPLKKGEVVAASKG